MKVLYVASNPDRESSLALEREITEFRRRAVAASGDPADFIFLPNLPFEDFPTEISRHKPDILHISAHGDQTGLEMSQDSKTVHLTAEILSVFLDINPRPKLVYISACGSETIAKELTKKVAVAIGTTAEITNHAARSAALNFYIGLLEGKPVESAFEVGRMIMKGLGNNAVDSKLFNQDGVNPKTLVLHQPARIMASFFNEKFVCAKDNHFEILLGVTGCPRNTIQTLFFTDDETFINSEDSLESDLCSIIRTIPDHGVIWLSDPWRAYGDHRIFACGTSAAGEHFSITSSLCLALEEYYVSNLGLADQSHLPGYVQNAIAELRRAAPLRSPPKASMREPE